MVTAKQSWLGEVEEQTWLLTLRPSQVLRAIEDNTDVPFRKGGPAFSNGRVVSDFEDHQFRLHVTTMIGRSGVGIPRLIGRVTPTDTGSLLTFRIELPLAVLVWLPVLVGGVFALMLGVGMVILALGQGANDPVGLVLTGLCCGVVPAVPFILSTGFLIHRPRAMSARLQRLMTDLFDGARVLDVEIPSVDQREG